MANAGGRLREGDGDTMLIQGACCFWRQHRPVPHLGLWSESQTGNLMAGRIPAGQI